jgi:phosphoribosylformylglycinamidine synthase
MRCNGSCLDFFCQLEFFPFYVNIFAGGKRPQGLTIKHALESLGFKNITEARIGKSVSLCLDADDKEQAQAQVEEMCQKLLANPIIEDFSFEVKKA